MGKTRVAERGIALLGTVMLCTSALAQASGREQSKVEVPLTEELAGNIDVEPHLQSLEVLLSIDQQQTGKSHGLQATAVFKNHGADAVSLLGLKEVSILEIQTSDGWPVKPPVHVPDFFINSTTRTLPSLTQIAAVKNIGC